MFRALRSFCTPHHRPPLTSEVPPPRHVGRDEVSSRMLRSSPERIGDTRRRTARLHCRSCDVPGPGGQGEFVTKVADVGKVCRRKVNVHTVPRESRCWMQKLFRGNRASDDNLGLYLAVIEESVETISVVNSSINRPLKVSKRKSTRGSSEFERRSADRMEIRLQPAALNPPGTLDLHRANAGTSVSADPFTLRFS